MQKDRAIRHSGEGGDAGVLAVESEFGVDLVTQYQEVFLSRKIGNLGQLLTRTGSTGRITGKIENQDLGSGLPSGLKRLGREREVVFGVSWHGDGLTVGQFDARMV